MRPKEGRTERNQPPTIPAISAPPAVESVGESLHLEDKRANQGAENDPGAYERDISNIRHTVWNAQQLGDSIGILRAADYGEDVAAVNCGVRKDGDRGGSCAPHDLRRRRPWRWGSWPVR